MSDATEAGRLAEALHATSPDCRSIRVPVGQEATHTTADRHWAEAFLALDGCGHEAEIARLREGLGLLNSLGIAGPNIRHVVQTEPDPKWDREELDVWEMTKDQTWCVCGREWPCEALRLDTLLCAALARLEGAS